MKFVIDLGTVTWLTGQLDLLFNILANYIKCLSTVHNVVDFETWERGISSLSNLRQKVQSAEWTSSSPVPTSYLWPVLFIGTMFSLHTNLMGIIIITPFICC